MTNLGMQNIHATTLLFGDQGVLIRGETGTGKSALALALIAKATAEEHFAALVSDDRTNIYNKHGKLIALLPEAIAGSIEVRGAGLFILPYEKQAVIHLLVDLVSPEKALRYPDDTHDILCNVTLPCLRLPAFNTPNGKLQMACQAVEATLFMHRR